MNVNDGIALYLTGREGELRPQTWAKHRMTLKLFALAYGTRNLDEIRADEITAWRNGLGVAPSSANKYVDRVSAMYRYLRLFEHIHNNPCERVRPLHEPPARRVRLPNESLPLMLAAARHPRDRALIATALELLLRGGELAELRVGDVLDGALRVVVEKSSGELAVDEMAISAPLERELQSWLGHYRKAVGITDSDAYLFPRLTTRLAGTERQTHLDPAVRMAKPEEVVKLALAAAGVPVPKGTGVHAIRRTCARLLFDHLVDGAGVDRALAHVSSLMHHSSRRTTELYLGVSGDRALRNKLVRESGVTPLSLATATLYKPTGTVSALPALSSDPTHGV